MDIPNYTPNIQQVINTGSRKMLKLLEFCKKNLPNTHDLQSVPYSAKKRNLSYRSVNVADVYVFRLNGGGTDYKSAPAIGIKVKAAGCSVTSLLSELFVARGLRS